MRMPHKKLFAGMALILWIFVWTWFTIRSFCRYDLLRQYATLLQLSSLEEKRANVTTEDLYKFITFCSDSVPADSTYVFYGCADDQLSDRRVVYYMYPCRPGPSPEFILVYGNESYEKEGYRRYKTFAEGKFILTRSAT